MLYKLLKNYTLQDAIKIEQQDRQFLALKKLYENKKFSDEIYILLVVINALISFQLSWKGEDYWEEFGGDLEIYGDFGERTKLEEKNNWNHYKKTFSNHLKSSIYAFFEDLLKNGKNNRRFVDMKLKRVEKFLNNWVRTWYKNYYKNMGKLAEDLAKIMNQQKDAKTIVFAVKMFSYAARNVFAYLEYFPFDLAIPVDSRLENLYKKYVKENFTKKEIKQCYLDLAKKLNIPPLHLDAILWVNYERFFDKN